MCHNRNHYFCNSRCVNFNKKTKVRMPKLYEYLGILIFFYSNEHEPIHVHARKGEYESKAEIIVVNGKVNEIVISNIKGKNL